MMIERDYGSTLQPGNEFPLSRITVITILQEYYRSNFSPHRLANQHNSFLHVLNTIYRGCFIVFYRDWKATGKTIIDFQYALQSE